jgi:DNA-binding cell septation regulator SpoVG
VKNSESVLRRAEAASWGPRPQNPEIKILRVAALTGGAALAFFDVELASGLIVRDCKLMPGKNGGAWVATPTVKLLDRAGQPILAPNGKQAWRELVGFRDRQTRDKFTRAILAAFERQHPGVIDGSAS